PGLPPRRRRRSIRASEVCSEFSSCRLAEAGVENGLSDFPGPYGCAESAPVLNPTAREQSPMDRPGRNERNRTMTGTIRRTGRVDASWLRLALGLAAAIAATGFTAAPVSPEAQAAIQGVLNSGKHPWLT